MAEPKNCEKCANTLTGTRFVMKDKAPICLSCYESHYADTCANSKCRKKIGMDCKDLSYKGKHWHEQCFTCAGCTGSIMNREFVAKDESLYCTQCYDSKFATTCDSCNKIFKHGMQKFEYNSRKYHLSCFLCMECNQPINNNAFVPNPTVGDQHARICMTCYNDKHAQTCKKCNEMILRSGLLFRDVPYHNKCFTCDGCKKELANTQFVVKHELPFCAECYVEKFSTICDKCVLPISNVGTPQKYVAFNQRQWHSECFVCNGCDQSLLGQGFLVANGSVYCPGCSKTM